MAVHKSVPIGKRPEGTYGLLAKTPARREQTGGLRPEGKPTAPGQKSEAKGKPTAPESIYDEERKLMGKIVQFFKESYAELRKVIWPSKDEAVGSVAVVIVSTVIVAAVLGLVDMLLLIGVRAIF
jgi:preprotein translocase subunit SecE